MTEREGVIKFRAHHTPGPLPAAARSALVDLLPVRHALFEAGLLGQDPARYHGLGYGNVSRRVPGGGVFLVSGVQTSGRATVDENHFALVHRVSLADNEVVSEGPVEPSSESLTHAAILDLSADIDCVLHVHAPTLFARATELELPVTDPSVPYGTQAMAREVRTRLGPAPPLPGLCVMGGHTDGVLAFGASPGQAWEALRRAWETARGAPQKC